MRIGVFADVHANLEALEAVLGILRQQGVTHFACCGDIVGYGPDPGRCCDIICQLRCPVVAGNHDYGVLGRTRVADFNPDAAAALRWTREQLTEDRLLLLDGLPLTTVRKPLLLVHGSPSAPEQWEYIFTVREAEEEMRHFSEDICIVGHTHYPFAVAKPAGQPAQLIRAQSFQLAPGVKYLVNAGSVGQPRDGDPRACGLVLDTTNRTITFFRVPYDVARVQRKIIAAGLPESLAARLAVGR